MLKVVRESIGDRKPLTNGLQRRRKVFRFQFGKEIIGTLLHSPFQQCCMVGHVPIERVQARTDTGESISLAYVAGGEEFVEREGVVSNRRIAGPRSDYVIDGSALGRI